MTPAEVAIHEIEMYLGVLIGAVTFSGSVIAFGKLSARISGKPVLIPGRHWINLAGLLVVIWCGAWFINAQSIEEGLKPLAIMAHAQAQQRRRRPQPCSAGLLPGAAGLDLEAACGHHVRAIGEIGPIGGDRVVGMGRRAHGEKQQGKSHAAHSSG